MGVGEGVRVGVGTGEGVIVLITTLGGGRVPVATGGTRAGWQAARRNKKNRLRRCFMDKLYHLNDGERRVGQRGSCDRLVGEIKEKPCKVINLTGLF